MRNEAYEEETPEEEPALKAASKADSKKITKALPPASAARQPKAAPNSSTDTAKPPAGAADTALATENITPKTVIAKDIVAIEERRNYAAQLPNELLQKGVEAKVNVVGELADVIILSSPAFDARSKDTVIKQVCIDLKTLGFKRVHITDGGDYTMHFGL